MRIFILLFICCCTPAFLFAQSLELTLASDRLPSDLSEWSTDKNLIHLAFTSPEAMKFDNAHIVFAVTEGIEHIMVSTRTKFSDQPGINGTFKKRNFKFEDISGSAVDADPSVISASSTLGKLPGGLYTLCFYLVDSSGKQIGNISQACSNFAVRDFDAPILLAPTNETVCNMKLPLAFSWSAANVLSQTIHYKLKLFPFYEGQTPQQAMASSSAFYASDDIFSTTFVYPSDAPSLSSITNAKGFTWVVTQYDQDGRTIGKNYGRSIPSVFYLSTSK